MVETPKFLSLSELQTLKILTCGVCDPSTEVARNSFYFGASLSTAWKDTEKILYKQGN